MVTKPSNVISPPLLFLRKVRDVMGSSDASQDRLNHLVEVIASEFSSDVCSIYLLRAGDVLELFATYGLSSDAVHNTRLQVGEGLVGEIAQVQEPLNLAHAERHEKFLYRPETGEDAFHGFVGVPIMRGVQVLGVLVAQREEKQLYSDEQVELLQTVSMVLAELLSTDDIISLSEVKKAGGKAMLSLHVTGLRFAPGLAQATAVLHRPRIEIATVVAESPAKERNRLQTALESLRCSIDDLIKESHLKESDPQREIYETFRMFAHDKGWVERILQAINLGLTAEAAVQRVQEQLHARMNQVSSLYLHERVRDLEELSNRLLQHLTNGKGAVKRHLPEECILIARNIGPVELLEYGRRRVKGLVLEEGSSVSHIIIIARAMGIPVVGKIRNAMELVQEGDRVVVDGDHGEVYIRPTHDERQSIREHMEQYREQHAFYDTLKKEPSITKDGQRIGLNINAGLFVDVKSVREMDVDGIGLYRTELPYMLSAGFPDVESQSHTYAKVFRQVGDKRVIFRTFDVGGDKPLPYFHIPDEENPAMGWRAMRIGIDRPSILKRQFRSLIAAAAGRELDVMFPFITQTQEFDRAKELFDAEMKRAEKHDQTLPTKVRLGAMVEVPALLWQIPVLAQKADFISIGSNDLLQFLFASDRGNPHLVDRYDSLSPVVLQIVQDIIIQCEEAGTEVCFCGEMARKPLEAMALIGLGIRKVSIPASAIGPIKAMVRSVDMQQLAEFMEYVMTLQDDSVRARLTAFAHDHGVII